MKTIVGNIRSWSDVRTKLHGLKSFVDYFGKTREVGRREAVGADGSEA
jgi:hypothetical protein